MKKMYLGMISLAVMSFVLISCGKDDEISGDEHASHHVVIENNGATSNGSVFSAIDDKNFYLDYVKYTVEEGHLIVSGYDKVGFNGRAIIASGITYKGNIYKVLRIGESAFENCGSKTYFNEAGVAVTDENGALNSVSIPDGITSIGDNAFKGCNRLSSLTIPNSVTSIGNYAFAYCSKLTSVTIPDGIKVINTGTFEGCASLNSMVIPNGVTSIEDYAFYDCRGMTSFDIPNGVMAISCTAFDGCDNLQAILCSCITPPKMVGYFDSDTWVSYDSFEVGLLKRATLYVPKGTMQVYKEADGWNCFEKILEK